MQWYYHRHYNHDGIVCDHIFLRDPVVLRAGKGARQLASEAIGFMPPCRPRDHVSISIFHT
eukprot:5126579-Amphidinium_carterae.1